MWTGTLRAEQYGVPQTRKRAILTARRDGAEARQPPPTHRRYIAPGGNAKPRQEDSLFDAPEPEHRVERGEEELLPWVSMADALGWGVSALRGNNTIAGGPLAQRDGDTPAMTVGTRADLWHWTPDDQVGFPRRNDVEGDDGEYRERDLRPASDPAFALTEKARSWTRFRPAPTIVTTRKSKDGMIVGRQLPAGEGEHVGGKDWDAGVGHRREDVEDDEQKNAVRVTVQEAAMLQSFPADYPWQGVRSKVFEQIGNAVPPLLALAILREVTG